MNAIMWLSLGFALAVIVLGGIYWFSLRRRTG
jgi:hypothetical protein